MFNIQEALKDIANEFKYLQDTSVEALETELLWENPSPTSSFAAQTVSLDLSEYSKIIIEFNSDTPSGVRDIQTIINPVVVGKGGVAIRFGGVQDKYLGNIHFRYYQTTNSSITFDNSYYQGWTGTTTTLNNNFVIPYRIYGIKSTAASVISGGAGSGGAGMSYDVITEAEIDNICDTVTDEMGIIPIATKEGLGCVSVGDGLTIDSTGKLTASSGIGSAGMKLLWENENPTASFAPQTIELDLSEYDEIAIDFIYSGTYSNGISRTVFQKDVQKAACMGFIGNVLRLATCTDTGVQFGYGEYYTTYNSVNSITQENLVMIPQRIYGVDIAPPNVDYTLTEEKTIQELLWTNPNPTAEFAAQTINLDLSEYDYIMLESKFSTGADQTTQSFGHIPISDEDISLNRIQIITGGTSAPYMYGVYRDFTVYSTGVNFGVGYRSKSSMVEETSNAYSIPMNIYGIKNKINVTTAVVTDKGQHTDLLWENASPTAAFAAQTIELDLNGYNEVEIVYKVDNGTTAEQQSMTAVVGRTCRLDAIGQSSGKPHVSKRNATINETSIVFEGSSYVTASTSDWVSSTVHVIPVEIYGIKHNAATTSTIMDDYVIEQGTSDIWQYRKWANGMVDCWGKYSVTTAGGGLTAETIVILPTTFKDTNYFIQYSKSSAGNSFVSNQENVHPETFGRTTTQFILRTYNSSTVTVTQEYHIYVHGMWK